MSDSVKDKPSRAEKTRLTRRRIVAAAADLFLDQGYGATTLDQVAARAGVAVQTVYFHFGNKATLLKEALDVAAVGDDEPVALLDRPWLEELTAEPDPVRVIELWTNGGREILERVAPLLAVVRGTVGTDPDLAAQWDGQRGPAPRRVPRSGRVARRPRGAPPGAHRRGRRRSRLPDQQRRELHRRHGHPRLDAGTLAAHHGHAARRVPARRDAGVASGQQFQVTG